jgi:predicted SnoaL-like aldol condensation-catalyzing enzyme
VAGAAHLRRIGAAVTNREIVEHFLDMINTQGRVREAFERHVHESYVQHNPTAGNGREDAIALIEGLVAAPGFHASVKRIVADGDLVAVHMHVRFSEAENSGMAVMDMFRLENGKIVEHWDVIQEVPAETVSGNSMF